MSRPLLLLRPQPGNDETAARARALGITVVQVPLFAVAAAPSAPIPAGPFDALLLTSANGARFGGEALAHFADLPLYAVGAATAAAARAAGHGAVITGGGDVAATVAMIAAAGRTKVLHLSGMQVRPFDCPGLAVTRLCVYEAVERPADMVLPQLEAVGTAVAALHSPRAARRLAALIDRTRRAEIHLAAISPATALASGSGWSGCSVSASPDDTALLALVETLCIGAH